MATRCQLCDRQTSKIYEIDEPNLSPYGNKVNLCENCFDLVIFKRQQEIEQLVRQRVTGKAINASGGQSSIKQSTNIEGSRRSPE